MAEKKEVTKEPIVEEVKVTKKNLKEPTTEENKVVKKKLKEEQTDTVEKVTTGYVHIDVFLGTAKPWYGLSEMQVQGFKSFMQGKQYQFGEQAFVPYLEKYLGREVK
ncbi:hypothetical protein [Listeria virus P61]|nr:hypothetical protein [Listeria virus P61]